MKICIKDLRTLNAIRQKYGLTFHHEYKYIMDEDILTLSQKRQLEEQGFKIVYVDGCFYPYLFKVTA